MSRSTDSVLFTEGIIGRPDSMQEVPLRHQIINTQLQRISHLLRRHILAVFTPGAGDAEGDGVSVIVSAGCLKSLHDYLSCLD
jgi:hypothetical protein